MDVYLCETPEIDYVENKFPALIDNGESSIIQYVSTLPKQNILFVDVTSVREYEILIDSTNDNVLAIPYDPNTTTRLEIETLFANIYLQQQKCNRIGFVFSTYGDCVNTFLENSSYDDDENVDWLSELIHKYEIHALDFFGCKTLRYDSWKKYYRKLSEKTNIAIYANKNLTGNSACGGKWILSKLKINNVELELSDLNKYKSLCYDIDLNNIYFNSKIAVYKHLFDVDGLHNNCYLIDLSGFIWSSGLNNYNMLGQGTGKGTPTFFSKISTTGGTMPSDYNTKIQTVGNSTGTFFVSLKNSGQTRLYYVGYNSQAFAVPAMTSSFGNSNVFISCASYNQLVDTTTYSPVVKMEGANLTSLRLLTASGDVYQSGFFDTNTLGENYTIVPGASRLVKSSVTSVSDLQVSMIDPSYHSTLLLKTNNTVIGYGSSAAFGSGGALGTGTTITTISAGGESSFTKISMSNTHTIVLSSTGKIYCTGYNTNEQFGNTSASTVTLNNTWYQMSPPAKLPSTGAPTISSIVTGQGVSYILYSDGSLYGCGNNAKNQINSSATASYSTLQLISPPFRKNIKQVSCMINSTQILTTDNIPYSVGNDASNGIGIGSSVSATVFTQMSTSSDRSTLMTNILNIGGTNPITVYQKIPIINSVVSTPTLNSIRVSYTAISDVTDASLNYYYYLDNSTTPILAGNGKTNPFDISGLTPVSHTVALVGMILDSNSNILWSSSVTPDLSAIPNAQGSAPSNVSITQGINSLTYSYTESSGGYASTIKYYYSNNNSTALGLLGSGTTDTSFTVSGLVNQSYAYYIIAIGLDSSLNELWRASILTTATIPYIIGSTPSITVSAVDGLEGALEVYYTNSTGGNPAVTKYQYYTTPPGVSGLTDVSSSSPFIISSLIANTAYTITMRALGSNIWTSNYQTSTSVTTNQIGSTPTITNVSPIDGSTTSLSVAFNGSTGGYPELTKYQYSIDSGSTFLDASGTSSPIIISGLTTGTSYTVILKAVSGTAWTSSNSTISSSIITNKIGSAPIINSVSPKNQTSDSINVYFTDSSGGYPALTKYQYSINSGLSFLDANVTTNPITISGLNAGTSYTVILRAQSGANWTSPNSEESQYVTTNNVGSAPNINNISIVSGSVTSILIDFSGSIGGNPALTKYQYSIDYGLTFTDLSGTTSPITVSGFKPLNEYVIMLRAVSGSNWTSPNSNLSSITMPSIWVCGGKNTSGTAQIAYSSDGLIWTNASNIPSILGSAVTHIAHNGSVWVAGSTSSGSSSSIAYSYDGITWTASSSGRTTMQYVNGVAFGNGMFVAVGSGGSTIMYSTDGINWTGCAGNNFFGGSTNCWGMGAIYANSTWVAYGGSVGGNNRNIGISTNGINWTLAPSTNFTEVNEIDWNGTNWVIVGHASDHIMYTTNINSSSLTSTGVGTIFGSVGRGHGVKWNGSKFIAVGRSFPDIQNKIAVQSTNGISWTVITSSAFNNGGRGPRKVNFNNGRWILTQYCEGSFNGLVTSTDNGVTWSGVTTNVFGVGSYVYGLEYAYPPPNAVGTAPNITSIAINNPTTLKVFFYPGIGGRPAPTTYFYSLNGGATYTNANSATSPILIGGLSSGVNYNVTLIANNLAGNTVASNIGVGFIPYPCFLEGTKILRIDPETDDEEYIAVENLRRGDLIKTANHGYKAIELIGSRIIEKPLDISKKSSRLYWFRKSNISWMTEDLCVTGDHCILHKTVSTEKKHQILGYMGDIYVTEDHYRVPAFLDDRAEPYDDSGSATIWHFALENPNIYHNYGVWANGLLVESSSLHYMYKHSNMRMV